MYCIGCPIIGCPICCIGCAIGIAMLGLFIIGICIALMFCMFGNIPDKKGDEKAKGFASTGVRCRFELEFTSWPNKIICMITNCQSSFDPLLLAVTQNIHQTI